MEKAKKNVPEIRFPGFTDPWEQRKLESLCDVFTDGDWIEAKDQSSSGIRLVQTGNVGTTEYLDKEKNKKWISEETFERLHCEEIYEGDILISRLPEPAGRACIMPNLGTRMITAVDCTIVRTAKDFDSKYLVQYLSTPMYFKVVNSFLGGGTRQRISRGNLSGIDIPIPSTLEEQKRIGEYFANIDNLITLHQRKCDELKRYKKGLLQQMFPHPGELFPRVRFPGFTDPWEQRKLEELFTERHILSKITEEYPRLSFTIEEGVIHPEDRKTNKRDFLMKDESNKKFLVTELEDIIYNPANVVWGALHRNTYGKGCLSPIYKIFSTDENPAFIECILRSPSFIRALSQKTEGTVVKLKTLKPEAFLEMSISVAPQRAEQDAIAAVFEQIDNLITLHQRKCDELKTYKKGLLQKMFV